jgi:hypothetical protein
MPSFKQRLKREIKAVIITTLYFGLCIGALLVIKYLLLAQYDISFYGWTAAIVGVLLLAKVVLVLERVPLGRWVRTQPAWVDIILRTILYAVGVVIVLALEHGIRGWREHGGFFPGLSAALERKDAFHVWVNTFSISLALLGYNILAVLRRRIGEGALLRMFLAPMPAGHERTQDESTQSSA